MLNMVTDWTFVLARFLDRLADATTGFEHGGVVIDTLTHCSLWREAALFVSGSFFKLGWQLVWHVTFLWENRKKIRK